VLQLSLGDDVNKPLSILCLGAHSDDVEIGAGGTLLSLLADRPGSRVRWVVFSADDEREEEARRSAAAFAADAQSLEMIVHRFRESYFPYVAAEIKDAFEHLKAADPPDLVLTHRREDEHQDHRTIAQFTWNTFRNHLILEYEIPKYEGDLGRPNVYVSIAPEIAERKTALLMEHFGTQRNKHWFRPETFSGLMAVRGVECGASSAEAFYASKVLAR
jgi:LmbE family N-acetylglucosaminyl deacetylase